MLYSVSMNRLLAAVLAALADRCNLVSDAATDRAAIVDAWRYRDHDDLQKVDEKNTH